MTDLKTPISAVQTAEKPVRKHYRRSPLASAKRDATIRAKNMERYADILPRVRELRDQGLTQIEIAELINATGRKTSSGMPLRPFNISRLLNLRPLVVPETIEA